MIKLKFYLRALLLSVFFIAATAIFLALASPVSAGTAARQCDIWGIDFSSEPVHITNAEGNSDVTIRVTDKTRFRKVWRELLGVTNVVGMSVPYAAPGALCVNNKPYNLSAIFNSETEGTRFQLASDPAQKSCTKGVLIFPSDVFSALSVSCPFLALGMSQADIESRMGPPDVRWAQSWFYFRPRAEVYRRECLRWLKRDEDGCCFPGIKLDFQAQRLSTITISNGQGEGPHCPD